MICFLDWNRHSNLVLDLQMAIVVSDEFFILNDFEIVNRFFGLMTYNQSFISVTTKQAIKSMFYNKYKIRIYRLKQKAGMSES